MVGEKLPFKPLLRPPESSGFQQCFFLPQKLSVRIEEYHLFQLQLCHFDLQMAGGIGEVTSGPFPHCSLDCRWLLCWGQVRHQHPVRCIIANVQFLGFFPGNMNLGWGDIWVTIATMRRTTVIYLVICFNFKWLHWNLLKNLLNQVQMKSMHGQSLVFSDHKKGVHHDYISMLMTWKEWGKGESIVLPNRWILSRAELKFNQATALFCAYTLWVLKC